VTRCDVDDDSFLLACGNIFKNLAQMTVVWAYFIARIDVFNEIEERILA
jgi:hypothetical protein